MKSRLPAYALFSGMAFCTSVSTALAAATCPLDHAIFTDQASGRPFVAQKVAMDLTYRCAKIYHFPYPQPRLEGRPDCRGPVGDTVVQGRLGKAIVYAVLSKQDGAPCCRWDSFEAKDRAVASKTYRWLSGPMVPSVELGNERDAIESSGTLDPMKGPLAGGEYVPVRCRE